MIVGVDMSGHSRQALRIAAEEARLRGAALQPVEQGSARQAVAHGEVT